MEYKLGNSKHIVNAGTTKKIRCPKCGNTVPFALFKNAQIDVVPKFPLITDRDIYFLICSSCGAVFSIPTVNGKAFEKGDDTAVRTYDLEEPGVFKP